MTQQPQSSPILVIPPLVPPPPLASNPHFLPLISPLSKRGNQGFEEHMRRKEGS